MFTPKDKCAFISVYQALMCKKSPVIKKYNITSIENFYCLIMDGNSEHPSIFDKPHPLDVIKPTLKDIMKDNIKISNGGVPLIFFDYLSKYFNISIILNLNEKTNTELYRSVAKHCLNNGESIEIEIEENHAYYKPKPEEEDIFNKIEDRLVNQACIEEEFNTKIDEDSGVFTDDQIRDILSEINIVVY